MVIKSAELMQYIGVFLWPLFRIAGLLMTAPIFGAKTVPVRIRLGLSVAVTVLVLPLLPKGPEVDVFSPASVMIVAMQLLIGVVMGFTLQLVLSAVVTGGQVIAMQMGLGFAAMVDPQNGAQTPILSQFYVIMVILVYLALNGHLVLFQVLVDSFTWMPIGSTGLEAMDFHLLVRWASTVFSGAIGLAMPAIASLLIVNFTFGILTRAAPQMNIFAVGFPITMLLGFGVVFATLPSVVPQTTSIFNDAYELIRTMLDGG